MKYDYKNNDKKCIDKLLSISKKDDVIIKNISQCTSLYELKKPKKIGIQEFYFMEYHSDDTNTINHFFKNITLLNISNEFNIQKSNRVISVNVTGEGYWSVYFKRYDKKDVSNDYSVNKYRLFKLNVQLLDKILTNDYSYLLYYYKYFKTSYRFINNDRCIMIPDFGKLYVNNNISKTIKLISKKYNSHDFSFNKSQINHIRNIKYKVYIKDNNININSNDDHIINIMKTSKYRHVFYLNYNDVILMTNIKKDIIDFFEKFGIYGEDLDIRIVLSELRYKTSWITFDLKLRNVKNYYYQVHNEIYDRNSITLDELISMLNSLKKSNYKLYELLNNKFEIKISDYTIKEHNLNINGTSEITYFSPVTNKIKKKFNYKKICSNVIDQFSLIDELNVQNVMLPKKDKHDKYTGTINNGFLLGYITDNNIVVKDIQIKIGDLVKVTLNECIIDGIFNNDLFTGIIKGSIQTINLNQLEYMSWHNVLFDKNRKFNENLKIKRILSYKGSSYNPNCGFSVCCSIGVTHYIINVIPRTSTYISHKYNNNVLDGLSYIMQKNNDNIERYIGSNNKEYFTMYFKHPKLYYLMEIINISPLNENSCVSLKDNTIIERSTQLLKKMVHIKLDESMKGAYRLINCYKKSFNIPLFIFFNNIIRNLHFFRNDVNYNHIKNVVFKKLADIEKTHYQNINKYSNIEFNNYDTPYTNRIVNYYNNDNFIFSEDIHNPFIGIISREVNNDYSSFKYIIWYTSDIIFTNISLLANIMDKLQQIYKNNHYVKNEGADIFDYTILEEESIRDIYKIGYKEFSIGEYKDNYLFNMSCMFKNKRFFKTIKKYISNIVNIIYEKTNIDKLYAMFHYPTVSISSTLHLQIYTKQTFGNESFSSMNMIGYMNYYIHEYTKYYFIDYKKIIYDVWPQSHPVFLLIPCAQKLVDLLNNYYVIYNDKNVLFKDIIMELILKKNYNNYDYDIVVNFLIECTLRKNNVIYNYLYNTHRKYSAKIYIGLLKYKNNFKIFLRHIYYIIS